MTVKSQPWLFSPCFDVAFILGPAILISILVLVFHDHFAALQSVPPWLWLLLVVGVDVSHVYSTLFRTYLDRDELRQRPGLYTLVPLGAWIAGCFLYSVDSTIFWRVLTYLAVFHFVRQQYGFMMIYGRQERGVPEFFKQLDKAAIYLATLYPLVYWHSHAREFNWFVAGDFVKLDVPLFSDIVGATYLAVISAYVFKEAALWKRSKSFNVPRNLLLLGTAISWYIGIVAFNNDVAFSATNILAHGIPYLALIWVYGHNRRARSTDGPSPFIAAWLGALLSSKTVLLYLGALFVIAFIEEGIWDGLVWRDHGAIFKFSDALPLIQSEHTLMWLVPLLTLPQATHYILDAFIWRLKSNNNHWRETLFFHTAKKS